MIVNIGCIYNIGERERVGRPGTTKTGKSFLLFPSYYLILINILLHIQVVIYKIHKTKRDWTCLELQVNRYCLTPKSSTGKAGARDAIHLEHR